MENQDNELLFRIAKLVSENKELSPSPEISGKIDISSLGSGTYFIELKSKSFNRFERFEIKKQPLAPPPTISKLYSSRIADWQDT